jgi:hypothetical protein
MTLPAFSLLYDYRCPFARNVHEHVLAAMASGLELDVTFEPYTLSQGHISDGDPDVWDDPAQDGALISLEASVAVRDTSPEHFPAVHAALFSARHVDGIALTTRDQVGAILAGCGVDADAIFAVVDSGAPRATIATNWRHYHDDLDVFGVPTFVIDDADATFVRLMNGPDPEKPDASVEVISGLLGLIAGQPEINELKHTRLSR